MLKYQKHFSEIKQDNKKCKRIKFKKLSELFLEVKKDKKRKKKKNTKRNIYCVFLKRFFEY